VRAGRLRDSVVIQRQTTARDTFGHVAGWETVSTVWSNIKSVSGAERLRANVTESRINVTIQVRYSEALMPPMTADAWRIVHGVRIFSIIAARPDFRRTEIIFDCSEGSIDGQ
jgi:SPP1 family predicted phage head-tail adaptor